MSMDIYISVVYAIRCGEFHAQGGDVAGNRTEKRIAIYYEHRPLRVVKGRNKITGPNCSGL